MRRGTLQRAVTSPRPLQGLHLSPLWPGRYRKSSSLEASVGGRNSQNPRTSSAMSVEDVQTANTSSTTQSQLHTFKLADANQC